MTGAHQSRVDEDHVDIIGDERHSRGRTREMTSRDDLARLLTHDHPYHCHLYMEQTQMARHDNSTRVRDTGHLSSSVYVSGRQEGRTTTNLQGCWLEGNFSVYLNRTMGLTMLIRPERDQDLER